MVEFNLGLDDNTFLSWYEFKKLAKENYLFQTSFTWTTSKECLEATIEDFPHIRPQSAELIYCDDQYLRFLAYGEINKSGFGEDCLFWVGVNYENNLQVHIATNSILTKEEIGSIKDDYRKVFPELVATDNKVPVKFWTNADAGPTYRSISLEMPSWEEIQGNYSSKIQPALTQLMAKREHGVGDGQLMLWYGPPGTGKTWALRSLISEWRDWATFNYIVDSEQFFGPHSNYMMQVIHSNSATDKWKVLVLEDCGEMLGLDAKSRMGNGFQRLLNLVDGLIGQGLKLLVFVTTNEELDKLHPAVSRTGRCFSKVEFSKLSTTEVAAWLEKHKADKIDSSQNLADLFGHIGSEPITEKAVKLGFGS